MKKIVGIFAIFSILIVGCGKIEDKLLLSKGKNRFVNVASMSDIRSIDPRIGSEFPSSSVIKMLYEGLLRAGEEDPYPGIAKSWEISEDQLFYTFHLRDAEWSNGDPVTAYDFEYAWKRSVHPLSAKSGAFMFYPIKNVKACLEGKIDIKNVGVKAVDEKTLVVELEHPAPYFLSLTTLSTFMPIHKPIDLEMSEWTDAACDSFVFNGPFILDRWKKGDSLILKKNENYWNDQNVKIPGVKIFVVKDVMTQFHLFKKGEIDWFGYPFTRFQTELLSDSFFREHVQVCDSLGVYWLFLNTEIYPLNNKNVRKALAYGMNREAIARHVLQMGTQPAMGILPKKFDIQETSYFDDGNLKKAREHFNLALKELEIKKEEFPKLTLSLCNSGYSSTLNQVIQQHWYEALGIDVTLDIKEWPIHFAQLSQGDFQIGEIQWVSWLDDPIYLLDTFRMKSWSQWEHPEYQRLLDLSDHEVDLEKRKEHFRSAEALLMEEMPVIPICFGRIFYMKNPDLKGVSFSSIIGVDFTSAYFESEE